MATKPDLDKPVKKKKGRKPATDEQKAKSLLAFMANVKAETFDYTTCYERVKQADGIVLEQTASSAYVVPDEEKTEEDGGNDNEFL